MSQFFISTYCHYSNETGWAFNVHGENQSLAGKAQPKQLPGMILKWVLQKTWNALGLVMIGYNVTVLGWFHNSWTIIQLSHVSVPHYCIRPTQWHSGSTVSINCITSHPILRRKPCSSLDRPPTTTTVLMPRGCPNLLVSSSICWANSRVGARMIEYGPCNSCCYS